MPSFTGGCQRLFQKRYFEDHSTQEPIDCSDFPRTGCEVLAQFELKNPKIVAFASSTEMPREQQKVEKIYEYN